MVDYTKLSDSELQALYQQQSAAATDYSRMSDAELMEAYKAQADTGGTGITIRPGGAPSSRSLVDRAAGLYKAADVGTAAGIAGLLGSVGDLTDLGAAGIGKASDYVSSLLGVQPYQRPQQPSILEKIPRSRDVAEVIQREFYGGAKPYEPQGAAEEYTKTIGEFLPGALMGGGGALARAGQVVLPAITSETVGRVPGIKGTKAEPIARFLGALTGGGASAFLNRPNTTRAALESQLPRGITPQMVDQADMLMQDAAQRGVPLTWPEALSQTGGRPVLTDLQRHLEASPQSAPQMAEFFGNRPQQVSQAGSAAISELSPGVPLPRANIGPEVGRTAGGVARDVERARTAAVEPYYTAASREHVPGPVISEFIGNLDTAIAADKTGIIGNRLREIRQLLVSRPGQAATAPVRTARETPAGQIFDITPGRPAVPEQYLTDIENLDRVRKYVRERTEMPQIGQDAITKEQGKNIYRALDDLEARMVAASPSFATGKQRFQEITEQYVRPIMEGPLGKLADKDITTKNAIKTLFQKGEQDYNAAEVGGAVRAVANRNPRAASDLVRSYAQRTFDNATRDLQTSPNQAGGAKFRARIAGSPEQRANLQAAVEALPDGAERWRGFNQFLDVMEATGARQGIGSRTAYNEEIKQLMGVKGGIVSTAYKAAGKPTQFFQPIIDKFEQYRYGRNLADLATVLTDPQSAGMLRELARANPASHRAASLSLALVNYANAIGAHRLNKPKQ